VARLYRYSPSPLRQLADSLPVGGTLTLSRYRDLGGVRGALTRHADAALAEAVRVSDLTEREVLAGLTRLVTVDETGRRARRRIKITALAEPMSIALQVFVERRLLLSDTDDDGHVWLTVAHEALLTGWRPLETATADITAALRTARAVEQAAEEWNVADRPEHFLWDAERLTATLVTLGMAGDTTAATLRPRLPSSRSMTRLGRSSTPPPGASTPSRSANGVVVPHHRRAVDLAAARDRRVDSRFPATRTAQTHATPRSSTGSPLS
jgi:hypothetical protein